MGGSATSAMARPSSDSASAPSSARDTRYGESGFTRTETMVRRSPYGPPVSATSSGGRRFAAFPSCASGFWSKEKMKYDLGFTSPSRLSVSAESSKAIPVRSRSSLKTASRGMWGKRAISPSTSAVRVSMYASASFVARSEVNAALEFRGSWGGWKPVDGGERLQGTGYRLQRAG